MSEVAPDRPPNLLAHYPYLWEPTVVRQAIETAWISASSGGHSLRYWCQQDSVFARGCCCYEPPAYRPDPTIPRRRHRPADQWRSERRRDPCTFRLGCHAPLCLATDAEKPPAEEIMSIGGAHGARRGTGPTYLDCPLSRGALYLILQNRISGGSGSPEIKLHRRGR